LLTSVKAAGIVHRARSGSSGAWSGFAGAAAPGSVSGSVNAACTLRLKKN